MEFPIVILSKNAKRLKVAMLSSDFDHHSLCFTAKRIASSDSSHTASTTVPLTDGTVPFMDGVAPFMDGPGNPLL